MSAVNTPFLGTINTVPRMSGPKCCWPTHSPSMLGAGAVWAAAPAARTPAAQAHSIRDLITRPPSFARISPGPVGVIGAAALNDSAALDRPVHLGVAPISDVAALADRRVEPPLRPNRNHP